MAETLTSQPGFNGSFIYLSGSIWKKPRDSLIDGYFATRLEIYFMMLTSPNTLISFLRTVFIKASVGAGIGLLLGLEKECEDGGIKIASEADWMSMRKQFS